MWVRVKFLELGGARFMYSQKIQHKRTVDQLECYSNTVIISKCSNYLTHLRPGPCSCSWCTLLSKEINYTKRKGKRKNILNRNITSYNCLLFLRPLIPVLVHIKSIHFTTKKKSKCFTIIVVTHEMQQTNTSTPVCDPQSWGATALQPTLNTGVNTMALACSLVNRHLRHIS